MRRTERQDPASGVQLRRWLDGTARQMFRGRVLPVDEAVARAASPMHVPDPLTSLDALIAATALVHGLTLVTRNRRDMERTGVSILSPWDDDPRSGS